MCHIGPLFKVARVQDHVGNIYDGNNDFFFLFFLFQVALYHTNHFKCTAQRLASPMCLQQATELSTSQLPSIPPS